MPKGKPYHEKETKDDMKKGKKAKGKKTKKGAMPAFMMKGSPQNRKVIV